MSDLLAALTQVPTTVGGATGAGIRTTDAGGAAKEAANFGQTFAQIMNDAAMSIGQGEAAAVAGLQGKASVQDVVQAVMKAEQTLQSMIAVRDKVIGAYLEVSRMQI